MRLKLINANTTASMTAKIERSAVAVAAPGTAIQAVSPRMGPASIETAYDGAFAVIGVIDEVRKGETEAVDAYVIACFGDPGLAAAREIAAGPVVGIAEAAMHVATLVGGGFSVVSMLERARPGLEAMVASYGMKDKCRSIRMTDLPVLALEEEGSGAADIVRQACRAAVEIDHADCIVLGCAGLTDLGASIGEELGVPVIDGVAAAVKLAEALHALKLTTAKHYTYSLPAPKRYDGMFQSFAPASR